MTTDRSSRAEWVCLALAAALWVVVDGYGARRVMAAGGRPWVAALMVGLPFLVTVLWWLGVRRVAARLTRRHGSPVASWVLRYGLLTGAILLGAAAVWTGQTHTRALRAERRTSTTTASSDVVPALSGPRATEIWSMLALAGGLASLAVVTLGVALNRRDESEDADATGADPPSRRIHPARTDHRAG